MIYNIARNELKNLFFSPVAWFILLAFLIQCSYFYHESLVAIAHQAEVLSENNPEDAARKGLDATMKILAGEGGFFTTILSNLFLFIPLLTMGLMNREIANGTIHLILSSPVKRFQLVLGKYLGIMLFNILLLLIVSVFLIATIFHVRNVELNVLVSALIGFTLVVAMFSAIGLLISSITKSQIIAAISTFMVLIFLTKIGKYWQEYDLVRDITYFLSFQSRVRSLLLGLFKSRDVLYFLVLIGMSLCFTWIRLDASIRQTPRLKTVFRYLVVLIVGLTIGVIGSMRKYTIYFDVTHLDRYTIPEDYQQLIKSFDKEDPLEVTFYTNLLHPSYSLGNPKLINPVQDIIWDEWIRFNPYIKFRYAYYYDYNPIYDHYHDVPNDSALFKQQPNLNLHQLAYQRASFMQTDLDRFKSPDEMKKEIDLDSEGYSQVMVLRYKGKSEMLRYYPRDPFYQFPDLLNISAALKRLLINNSPKVVFTTGHLERDIYKSGSREYRLYARGKDNRRSLINMGVSVDTVNLFSQEIPDSTHVLVVADPKTAYTPPELRKIESFIEQGGNVLFASVPGKQSVINPLLQTVGVEFMEGQIATSTRHHASDFVYSIMDSISMTLDPKSPRFAEFKRDMDEKRKMHDDPGPEFQDGAVAIKIIDSSKFNAVRIFKTLNRDVWLQRRPLILDSAKSIYSPQLGDSAGRFDIGMRLSRKIGDKEQRVIVMNAVVNQNEGPSVMELYSYLHYHEFPLYIPSKYQQDQIRIGNKSALRWRFVFLYVLPSLIFIGATILLIRRKRK